MTNWDGTSVSNGAHIPTQGETIITGKDSEGHELKVVAQVGHDTKTLASVMTIVDQGNWVILYEGGGYIQTMKKEEELKLKSLMNKLKGFTLSIERK